MSIPCPPSSFQARKPPSSGSPGRSTYPVLAVAGHGLVLRTSPSGSSLSVLRCSLHRAGRSHVPSLPLPLCLVVTKKSRERKPRRSLPSRLHTQQVVSGAALSGHQSLHRFTVNLA